MIAQEMSDTGNRGRVLWLLASSRPDLIEVDLKRPGRIDVKVPLLPTSTPAESAQLIAHAGEALRARARAGGSRSARAAHADAAHARRGRSAGGQGVSRSAHGECGRRRGARSAASSGYQNPVPADVLEFQMRLAMREATDLASCRRCVLARWPRSRA